LKSPGYTSRESTVGYSGIKVDDGLDNAEQAEVYAIVVTFRKASGFS
jgi:hypothetical protein